MWKRFKGKEREKDGERGRRIEVRKRERGRDERGEIKRERGEGRERVEEIQREGEREG